jgi:hypothetical protein
MGEMDEILAALSPEVLMNLAYLVGAFVIGATTIVGVFFLSDYFGRWFW